MQGWTYARARLWTGVSGVGTFVVLAATALVMGWIPGLFEGVGSTLGEQGLALFTGLLMAGVVALPFDIAGGYAFPKKFGRPHPGAAAFALGWLRGVSILAALSTLSGLALLSAGRAGGRPLALVVFALLCAAWIALQEPVARLVGGLRRVDSDGAAIVLKGQDPAFSGGFAGLSFKPVVSDRWVRELAPADLKLLLQRRRSILSTGAWGRTLAAAILWNVTGLGLASLLPGAGFANLAAVVTTAVGFTLWTFVGLLVLPTPSRQATLDADSLVANDTAAQDQLGAVVQRLDLLQDDEPERSAGLESVFHPIPSVGNRHRALREGGRGRPSMWHLARTALYMSHAGLSLLPRAVHCNAGRPELWVYLPSDG